MTPDPHDPYPDWTRRVAASDEAALAELFDAVRDPLLHYVVGLLRDEAAADDVVQETFVRLWRHRATLDPERSLRAFLYRTARNLAYNATRDARLRAALLGAAEDADSVLPDDVLPWRAPAPDRWAEALDLGQRLQAGIAALPERQREALVLSRFGGLTHDEAAGVMGCAPRTVNNHLVRALATLRAHLDLPSPGARPGDAFRPAPRPERRPPLATECAASLPPWSAPEALLP